MAAPAISEGAPLRSQTPSRSLGARAAIHCVGRRFSFRLHKIGGQCSSIRPAERVRRSIDRRTRANRRPLLRHRGRRTDGCEARVIPKCWARSYWIEWATWFAKVAYAEEERDADD